MLVASGSQQARLLCAILRGQTHNSQLALLPDM